MNFKSFLTEKNISNEDFAGKTAEDMANLYNEFNEKARKSLEEAIESKATKEDIEGIKSELKDAQVEQLKSLNSALKEQGIAIKKLSQSEKAATKEVSVKDNLEKGLEVLKGMKEGDKGARLSFKAAGTMLISTNVSGGNVPVEQRLEGMNAIASRQIRLLDIVSRGTASSNVISWVYQANKDGAAAPTAEGAAKNQIDFDLVVNSETVKKITAYIKVSEEMVDDIDFMNTEIRNELTRELLKEVEEQVYEGDGTGNNLNGIRTVATAFAAGASAGTIDEANWVDVLGAAATQIMEAEQMAPNYVLMHPRDIYTLKSVKVTSTDRRYVERLTDVAGSLNFDGATIIPSTLVTQGEYLIGYFPMATVYDKGAMSIEVGRDSDDFTKNLVTVLAEWRGLVLVKNNDRTAFVKGVLATDAAALETT